METLRLSNLAKTWLIDLDGTIVKHNGYKEGGDELLEGVKEFFERIPKEDVVIILTSRESKYMDETIRFLEENDIRFDHIIFDLPYGERILINGMKKSGMLTAYAINKERDEPLSIPVEIDLEM
ncbi:MAG TPA: hypothetical protein PLD16_07900 [Fervidobacterium sp.]|nr:hypothetical protein [Fervidobacterium sp.]